MKNFENYKRIIAIAEHSAGNESVGDEWIETKSFSKEEPIENIIKWGKNCTGKLIIAIDESDADDNFKIPI